VFHRIHVKLDFVESRLCAFLVRLLAIASEEDLSFAVDFFLVIKIFFIISAKFKVRKIYGNLR
jgi:hypothetical protein